VTADLATAFGLATAATDLLSGLTLMCDGRGRSFLADYLTLKTVSLSLDEGLWEDARSRLADRLELRLGPLEQVPVRADELQAWEGRCRWPEESPVAVNRPLFFSRLYHALGRWLGAQGYYGHATVLLGRGLVHAELPAPLAGRAWVPLVLELASVCLEQGRTERCREELARAEVRLDPRVHPGWTVQWLELSAHRERLLGDFGSALRRYDEVTDLCRDRGFVRATAASLMNQAEILIMINRVSEAEDLLTTAAELSRSVNVPGAAGRLQWLRAVAAERVRSPAERLALTPAVIDLRRAAHRPTIKDPDHDGLSPGAGHAPPVSPTDEGGFLAFFEDRASRVFWHLGVGEIERARELADELHGDFAASESILIRLRTSAVLGLVTYYQGEAAAANEILGEAAAQLRELGLLPELWQVIRARQWCVSRLGGPVGLAEELGREVERLLALMAETLRPNDMAVFLLNKWTVRERRLRAEIEALIGLQERVDQSSWYARLFRCFPLWRGLAAFLASLDRDRARWSEADEDPAAEQTGGGDSHSWFRLLVGPHLRSALVTFLVLPDRVFVATAGGFRVRCELGYVDRSGRDSGQILRVYTDRRRVRQLVALCHEAVQRQDTEGFDAASDRLAAELRLAPLLSRFPRWVRRLRIVADDALHGFPFAALRVSRGYLLERFGLVMSYDRMSPRRVAAGAPGRGTSVMRPHQALLVAVSRSASRIHAPADTRAAGMSAPALEAVVDEVAGVGRWCEEHGIDPVPVVDGSASTQAVLARWPDSVLVHVACHGIFEPDRPDASGLVLVPELDRGVILTLKDLESLYLQSCRHVTLSSCWGADNFVHPGRWVVALPETLCRRGVCSVLACLWEVGDQVAPAFMRRFYELLAIEPRDEALRRVQIECLRGCLEGARGPTTHPFVWAGFRLHGETGRFPVARVRGPSRRTTVASGAERISQRL
jgi:CHAT domain-containing protein